MVPGRRPGRRAPGRATPAPTMYEGIRTFKAVTTRSSRPRSEESMADSTQALDEVVELTSDLIRIDTTNRGGGDCARAPGRRVRRRAARRGGPRAHCCSSRTPGRTNVVARIEGTDPAATRAARPRSPGRRARRARRLDACTPSPARCATAVVWGRGAVDMKNMDAMMLAVVRAWARAGRRPRRDIVLAFTADEEDSAADGSGFLADQHARALRGLHRGHQRVRRLHLPRRRGTSGSTRSRAGERGTAWLEADRHGTGRARLQGQPGQRGQPAGRRRRPDRRARVAGAAHARPSGPP